MRETSIVTVDNAGCSAYRKVQADITNMSDEEATTFLRDTINKLKALQYLDTYEEMRLLFELEWDEEEWGTYTEVSALRDRKEFPRYTGSIQSDLNALKEVLAEYENCNNYTGYIQTVLDKTLDQIKATDKEKDSFSWHNLSATYYEYKRFENVTLKRTVSRSILDTLNDRTADLFSLFFIALCAFCAITSERENRTLLMSKTTKNGRLRLGTAKLAAVLAGGCVSVLFSAQTFIIAGILNGFPDLTYRIQSINGLQSCVLDVSIGGYLAVFLLFRLLFYWMFGAFMFFVCTVSKKATSAVILPVTAIILSLLLYNSVSSLSSIAFIKYMSPYALSQAADITSVYKNFPVLGLAINRSYSSSVLLIIGILLFSISGIAVFARTKEMEGSLISKAFPRIPSVKCRSASVFIQTLTRSMFSLKLLPILFISCLAWIVLVRPLSLQMGPEEINYRNLCEQLSGPFSEQSVSYLDKLENDIQSALELSVSNKDYSSLSAIQQTMNTIVRMRDKSAYLSNKDAAYILYDPKYELLTGSYANAKRRSHISALFLSVVCALSFCILFSADRQHGGILLLRTTRYGRRRYSTVKFLTALIIGTIAYIATWAPQLIHVLNTYHLGELEAPAYSISSLAAVPGWVSIKLYLAGIYILRYLWVLIILFVSEYVCFRRKSFVISAFIMLFLTTVPIVLIMILA